MKKYDQVIERVSTLIEQGTIADGQKVPSVRAMARQMRFGTMTVLEAYRRLEADGIIESRPRSGFVVRPKPLRDYKVGVRLPKARQTGIKIRTEAVKVPRVVEELFESVMQPDMVPLGAGMPDSEDLPSDELSLHMSRIARMFPNEINQYEIGRGDASLITEINKLMIDAGCSPLTDEVTVTAGITQGLLLALRAVTSPGDSVAVESPGYYGFYAMLEFLNLKAVEIPTDPAQGLDLRTLATTLKSCDPPRCLVLSSSFSNPTGALMPEEKRHELIKLSAAYDFVIMEDDTYGALGYKENHLHPLKALDPNHVVYLGSFSKVLAPGYRTAWVAGGRYADDIQRCYHMSVLSTPLITQRTIASYLKKGGMKQHLRRLRQKYHNNMRLIQSLVAENFPDGTRTTHPMGGHFLWVELPREYDAISLARKAMKEKISIAPGVLFSSRQHYRNHFRLNCAFKCDEIVVKAICRLGKLADRCGK
jgi:DNA-binding transcriptional MocR family regulator